MKPLKNVATLVLVAGLAGCATLPRSGPTGSQIRKSLAAQPDASAIQIVEVKSSTDLPAPLQASSTKGLDQLPPPPTDQIGPGDVLDVSIFEAGVSLFSGQGGASAGAAAALAAAPGVQAQRLQAIRVNDAGDIAIPYAGRIHVQGRTIGDVQRMIEQALRRVSQNPQVLVTVVQAITNTVIVSGEVARPGRLMLQTNRETLTDVIALAGGYRGKTPDLTVRVMRGSAVVDLRIDDIVDNPKLDVTVMPGDRLMLISDPRTFSVLGASGRVEQLPFPRASVSLAEAISTAGGVNSGLGDPRAIFLFRYIPDGAGGVRPVVYHINMMDAGSYLLSQRFTMRDKDVLYFGNAAANQPAKLFQLVSQLFTPLVTVTAAAQTLQN